MAGNEVRILIRAINDTKRVFDQVRRDMGGLEDKTASLSRELLTAGAILTGFSIAVKKAYDFGKEGAQIERLRETGTALAESFGVDMAEAVNKIKIASLQTISANQAVASVNRVLLLGITTDTDRMAKLMEIAALRGRAFGLSTEEAFDRITLGIGRLSTRILDDIGIVIDGETAYAKWGQTVGKTSDQLTENEKRLALTNAIIEEGNTLLEASGGLILDNAAAYEQLETNIKDTTNAWKEHLADALTPLIESLNLILFRERMLNEIIQAQAAIVKATAPSYEELINEQLRELDVTHDLNAEFAPLAKEFLLSGKSLQELQKEYNDLNTIEGLVIDRLIQMEAENRITTKATYDAERATKAYSDRLSQWTRDVGKAVTASNTWVEALTREEEQIEALNKIFPRAMARNRELLQFQEELADIQKDLNENLSDLNVEFSRDREDEKIDLARTLRDIDIKFAQDEEDRARDQARTLENIERNHQREIDRIMRRFELARLKALIDLDARALFEAEATRDSDLADAKASAEEKRRDEARDEEERKREDDRRKQEEIDRAKRHFEDQREDARRHFRQEKQDLIDAWAAKTVEIAEQFGIELENIKYYLSQETLAYQAEYVAQLSDVIEFVQARNNILSGNVPVVPSDWTGGGDGGQEPDRPPAPPPPPGGGTGPQPKPGWVLFFEDAYYWYYEDGDGNIHKIPKREHGGRVAEGQPYIVGEGGPEMFVPDDSGTIIPASGSRASQSSGAAGFPQNVRVTLDIRGDNAFAALLRSSVYDAFLDVVNE